MPVAWKSICAPTDFSDAARPGFQLAIGLALQFRAELAVVYAHELAPLIFLGGPVPQSLLDDLDLQADQALRNRVEDARRAGVKVVGERILGLPFDVIVRFARTRSSDLIVMSTHGRSALHQVLIGSVAEKVVRHATCPVLTVHSGRPEIQAK